MSAVFAFAGTAPRECHDFRDRLTWAEIGLLGYMMSLPKGRPIRFEDLLAASKPRGRGCSRDGLYTILRGLRRAGFVRMHRITAAGQVVDVYYTVAVP